MRRAGLHLLLLCAVFILMPAVLRAAADTDSRAVALKAQAKPATLPPAVAKRSAQPASTALTLPSDPHPVLTEFLGPAKPVSERTAEKKSPRRWYRLFL